MIPSKDQIDNNCVTIMDRENLYPTWSETIYTVGKINRSLDCNGGPIIRLSHFWNQSFNTLCNFSPITKNPYVRHQPKDQSCTTESKSWNLPPMS